MDRDVIYYYDEMQRNIKIVEDDEDNRDALDNVQINFLKLFEFIKMFLIAKKERYYGYFLMDFSLKIDFTANFCAGVSIDKYPFEMAINPLLLSEYTIKEIIFIVCHEIEHIVLDHPTQDRRINQDKKPEIHEKLNDAMDASINDRLIWDINTFDLRMMSFPETGITSRVLSDEYGRKFKEMEDFLYYYTQMKSIVISGEDDKKSEIRICVVMSGNGKKLVTNKNRPKKVLHIWTSEDNADDIHELIRKYVQQIVDGIPDENRGLFPMYQQAALNVLLTPPTINWRNVLKRYLALTPYMYRKTRMRLDRRQPERFDVPGRVINREVSLVVAIDTSGSVSESDLENIFTEIFAILRICKFDLTVIECDAEIQSVYKAKRLDEVNLKVRGRGGTSFVPVVEYVNRSKEFRNSVLVYFTDGMGDYSIPKPMVNRCLWVLTNSDMELSVKEPYGDVIVIN